MEWKGVIPAITTPFDASLRVDLAFMADHGRWLVDNGCSAIVALGSLGEGATLAFDEKIAILKNCVKAVGDRVPLASAISALSTREAVDLAKAASDAGCQGLMVLPPYVYVGDWREMKAHVSAIVKATDLSCMLYNNPIAYDTDFLPEQIAELASEHDNLHAVKESSTDARRVTAIKALLRDRLAVLVGVDDALVEGVGVGAIGWIAGLANGFPRESVDLLNFALRGERESAAELYYWFLPLLRMDTVPKFVQLIKLVQQEVGVGNARVRPPRMELAGSELQSAREMIDGAIKSRPAHSQSSSKMEQVSYAQ